MLILMPLFSLWLCLCIQLLNVSHAFTISSTKKISSFFFFVPPVSRTPSSCRRRRRQPTTHRAGLLSASTRDDRDDVDTVVQDEQERPSAIPHTPIPKDMKYNEYNLMRQNKNFMAIKSVGGSELTHDIYARDPTTNVCWFVGKIARISDVSVEKAVARQYPLIEEHSARLRPLELFDKKGWMELWVAPGDSELDVAYNRPHVVFVKMPRAHEMEGGVEDVRNVEVGFQGEIYEGGEEGFRTLRKQDGSPWNPEIQPQT